MQLFLYKKNWRALKSDVARFSDGFVFVDNCWSRETDGRDARTLHDEPAAFCRRHTHSEHEVRLRSLRIQYRNVKITSLLM